MPNVLITGGAGFLGRAILRRVRKKRWDWRVTVLSRDESKLVRVRGAYPEALTVKADVSDDADYLAHFFSGQDVVIHAAANKLVDVGERSAFEVVRNNIVGSRNVALAAMKADVKTVIGISSDKAVQPVNVYGMSKAVMERVFQEADGLGDTKFICARYGNVIGSTISIATYFEEQLRTQGHILVTNPAMTRFYMGVDDAIDLILYCLDKARRGSVVVSRMQGMSVADFGRMTLGLPRDQAFEHEKIKIVGERPGEKIHESLLHMQESVRVPEFAPDARYLELLPVGQNVRAVPFEITSDKPPRGWMEFDEMRRLIEDARHV